MTDYYKQYALTGSPVLLNESPVDLTGYPYLYFYFVAVKEDPDNPGSYLEFVNDLTLTIYDSGANLLGTFTFAHTEGAGVYQKAMIDISGLGTFTDLSLYIDADETAPFNIYFTCKDYICAIYPLTISTVDENGEGEVELRADPITLPEYLPESEAPAARGTIREVQLQVETYSPVIIGEGFIDLNIFK